MVTRAGATESNALWLLELQMRMRVGGLTTIEEGCIVKMAEEKSGFVHLGAKVARLPPS